MPARTSPPSCSRSCATRTGCRSCCRSSSGWSRSGRRCSAGARSSRSRTSTPARRAEAARTFAAALADVPAGLLWLPAAAWLAEAAARLGDTDACTALLSRLEPYAGRVVQASFTGCWGAVDRFLGLLTGALGRRADAERHLAARARPVTSSLGAGPLADRTAASWRDGALPESGTGLRVAGDHPREWSPKPAFATDPTSIGLRAFAARLLGAPLAAVTSPSGGLAAGVGLDAVPELCRDLDGPLVVTGRPSFCGVPLPGGGVLCVLDRRPRDWRADDVEALEDLAATYAPFDAVTGVADRDELYRRLESALASARPTRGRVSLLYLDLDNFKLGQRRARPPRRRRAAAHRRRPYARRARRRGRAGALRQRRVRAAARRRRGGPASHGAG